MATIKVEFISVDPGNLSVTRKDNRRKVRIQVMKDFRRKERERQAIKSTSSTALIQTATSILHPMQHIISPQLNQAALTQKLRDGWFPVGFGSSTLVPSTVRSWAPVLAILDSMKLVHLGSCVRDEQLLLEGRKRFLLAMNCLRGNLGHEPTMALPGLMLVSIGISMTEMYNAISDTTTPTSWQKHVVGMSSLLLKQRPIDPSSPLECFMIARLRCAQLVHSLCSRGPFPAEYLAPCLCSHSSPLEIIIDLALKLPPLLASTDLAVARASRQTPILQEVVRSLVKVVRDLLALEKMLDSWLNSFCQPTKRMHDDGAVLQHQATRPILLHDVTAEALCRICLLLLHQALSDLHSSHNSVASSQTRAQQVAASSAEKLYHTALVLSEAAERPVSKAIATRAPLHFLCRYYQSVGDGTGLQRCQELIENVRSNAPYVNWEMLLPWSLLPMTSVRRPSVPLVTSLPHRTLSESETSTD